MDIERTGDHLSIRFVRDFNYMTARMVERLATDARSLELDLSRSRIVDSEAIISLVRMLKAGKVITLLNAPEILDEAVEILDLGDVVDLDALKKTE